ncbi:MAG: YbaK/EbsC family protein [Bauldia sp.]|nr:YbaK/EbsC family protein [Bauldia sp.]
MASGSVERVRTALLAAGHDGEILEFAASTRTAAEAAVAVGCTVAQIAKSILLRAGERPVLVIASGVNRVDPAKVAALIGQPVERADGRWVREATGFAIGGVAPVAHNERTIVLIDRDIAAIEPVYAAAGSPNAVFRTSYAELLRLTGGTPADVREEEAEARTG